MCLAVPVRVERLLPDQKALVQMGGVSKEISLALVDDVGEGDYVVLHVGYALARLDPEEAAKTLALFEEIAAASAEPALARKERAEGEVC